MDAYELRRRAKSIICSQQPNVVTYATVISAYANIGQPHAPIVDDRGGTTGAHTYIHTCKALYRNGVEGAKPRTASLIDSWARASSSVNDS